MRCCIVILEPVVTRRARTEAELTVIAAAPVIVTRVALGEELQRAAMIRHQATALVRAVMQDARLGRAIELDRVKWNVDPMKFMNVA